MLSARLPCSLILRRVADQVLRQALQRLVGLGADGGLLRGQLLLQLLGELDRQLGEVVDEVERVLDLVRDAGGERAQRRELLLHDQLLLCGLEPVERAVQAPVGLGVVERDGRVGGQVPQDVEVVLVVDVLAEALRGDDADDLVLVDQRQVQDRRRAGACHRRHVSLHVLLALAGKVADDDLLAPPEAPHREPGVVVEAVDKRRQRLAVLLGRRKVDAVLGLVDQADAEHGRIHQRVHVLVDRPDDLLDGELRGDVAADAAEQLDVLVGLLELLVLLLQLVGLLLHGHQRAGLQNRRHRVLAEPREPVQVGIAERLGVGHVVEDEDALEAALQRDRHGQHRLGDAEVRQLVAGGQSRCGAHDVDALLDPFGALGIPARDVVFGQRDAGELLGVVAGLRREEEVVAVHVTNEERALLRPGEQLHALFEQRVQHALEAHLAVDGLHDLVQRLELLGLRPHFGLAKTDLLRAIGHHLFEAAALGPELARAKPDDAEDHASGGKQHEKPRPPRGVPRRCDHEGVDGLGAFVVVEVLRLHPEPEVTGWKIGVVALRLGRPGRPVAVEPFQHRLVLRRVRVVVAGGRELDAQRVVARREPVQRGRGAILGGAAEEHASVVDRHAADDRRVGRLVALGDRRVVADEAVVAAEPHDAVGLRVDLGHREVGKPQQRRLVRIDTTHRSAA